MTIESIDGAVAFAPGLVARIERVLEVSAIAEHTLDVSPKTSAGYCARALVVSKERRLPQWVFMLRNIASVPVEEVEARIGKLIGKNLSLDMIVQFVATLDEVVGEIEKVHGSQIMRAPLDLLEDLLGCEHRTSDLRHSAPRRLDPFDDGPTDRIAIRPFRN
jgi:hypothetical protein